MSARSVVPATQPAQPADVQERERLIFEVGNCSTQRLERLGQGSVRTARYALATALVVLLSLASFHAGRHAAGDVGYRREQVEIGTGADVELAEVIGLVGSCKVRKDWCAQNPDSQDKLSYRDCDGDGILDPYCEDEELLRFGYLSSKNKCMDNWPHGFCSRIKEPSMQGSEFSVERAASNEITIIHFNDVYQVSGSLQHHVRRGGMSRAAYVIQTERKRNPDRTFVVFAGDLLSPSVLSDVFQGEHMVDILNMLHLDAASLGNHEFDFGVDILTKRMNESKFPWLNINLMDANGRLLGKTQKHVIRKVPFVPTWGAPGDKQEAKVCIFGSTYDVRETMFKDKERITWKDTINASHEETDYLRKQEKCNVVLALTHQFSKEDCELARQMGNKVDLILGGHDHSTEMNQMCGNAMYIKADSDLKTQWIMTLWLGEDGSVESVDGRLLSLTEADPFVPRIHDRIVAWEENGAKELRKQIGCILEDLDAKDFSVRQKECAIGNFFTDSTREFHRTDVAMINGGTIRGNKIYSKGNLTKASIIEMHPFGNKIVKVHATGKDLHDYVGRMLDCYDAVCGAFVHISGLKYSFDSTAAKGQRLKSLMHTDGTDVKKDEKFTVAMSDYMLANSKMKRNKLYEMTTLNDAVPIRVGLFDAATKAGNKCIKAAVDGRIKKVKEALQDNVAT